MFGSKRQQIETLQSTVAELRAKVAELQGEARGEQRGRYVVAEQLAKDVRMSALREEQHRRNAAQSHGDLQRAMRIVAAHVLDVRGSASEPEAAEHAELLSEEFETAGLPLRGAFIDVQTARANATVKVNAAEAAAAVASAPVPTR